MLRFKTLSARDGDLQVFRGGGRYRDCSIIRRVYQFTDLLSATQNDQVNAKSFSTLLDLNPYSLLPSNKIV